jgi:hypothetical protein
MTYPKSVRDGTCTEMVNHGGVWMTKEDRAKTMPRGMGSQAGLYFILFVFAVAALTALHFAPRL